MFFEIYVHEQVCNEAVIAENTGCAADLTNVCA